MAQRTLTLAAYRALARRASPIFPDLSRHRPAGPLVWIHLGSASDIPAVFDLAYRLVNIRPGCHVLLTLPPEEGLDPTQTWSETSPDPSIVLETAPQDHPAPVQAFLDHWSPDLVLWIWGNLRAALIDETLQRAIPVHLVAAEADGFGARRGRWLPDAAWGVLPQMASITARSEAAIRSLTRLGLHRRDIQQIPGFSASGQVLSCALSDLDDLSTQLAGRPVWLAAQTDPKEWTPVLDAHRLALRNAHRLLLILHVASDTDLTSLRALLQDASMSFVTWSDGAYPTETTQVLIADLPDELGLWYRLATVSFLGQSLCTGRKGIDPMAAVALGTAILYGPNVRSYLEKYSQLAHVGAARIVNGANSLGTAVGQLIAPENAADMAHAGWNVATAGADVIDNLLDLVETSLLDAPRRTSP
ncbi:MAG: 3-deoxy-D-manno-octulosonic acid transferase [Paracoccaceae bacterium]